VAQELSIGTKSVTLNDLEQRNGLCLISPNFIALGPITLQWLKFDTHCLQHKCRPKNLVFGNV